MQITITLDSGEDVGIAEILAAVAASYGKRTAQISVPTSDPVADCIIGKTVAEENKAAAVPENVRIFGTETGVKEFFDTHVVPSMADVPVPGVVVAMADNGAHSYTEGMTTPVAPPSPVANTPVPPAPGVDLDKSGRPWDASVHSSSHEKTVDGMWKFRRGLDPAIRNAYQAGQAVPEQPPEAPEPPVAQIPTPPPVSPVAAAVAAWTFPRIMAEVTRRGLAQPQVLAVLKSVTGLNTLAELVAQPNAADLYGIFAAGLGL